MRKLGTRQAYYLRAFTAVWPGHSTISSFVSAGIWLDITYGEAERLARSLLRCGALEPYGGGEGLVDPLSGPLVITPAGREALAEDEGQGETP